MIRTIIVALVSLVISGCSQDRLLDRFTSPEDQAAAKQYIELLRQKNFDEVEKRLDPSLQGSETRGTLQRMSDLIPEGGPTSIKLVGVQTNTVSGVSTTNLTYEYEFSGKWLLISVASKVQGEEKTISGFHVYHQPTSLEEQNRFSLEGKTFIHYAVLVLAVLLPLFTLAVLIIAARTKIAKRKWLWIIFILCGVGRFTLNWTTGQWAIALLSFQLFSSGYFAPLYGQLSIMIAIPLGAIIFLLRRKKLGPPPASAMEERPYDAPMMDQSQ